MTRCIIGIVSDKEEKYNENKCNNDQSVQLHFQWYNTHIAQDKSYYKKQREQDNDKRLREARF